ncbi:hypothetical protein GCM10027285_25680 [Oleiagrimonas citrea]|uniref:PBS lyase n=1 Tax=Oleiagrimonas citrea TaxID=1665687 RepID=A0A846ZMV9_9GAMM|nr:HEAT repeat domain-containing protein [Oleiagrimonas citrea]NKZ38910.1 hypothetical protein [Oleiagrimonas citrea]
MSAQKAEGTKLDTMRAERLASDTRTTAELLTTALHAPDSDDCWDAIATLQCRGSHEELELAERLSQSPCEEERILAADVLGQMGWGERTLLVPSVDILLLLLGDTNPEVVRSAAIGLGHRNDSRAIPHLLKLKGHVDERVRYGIVHGLSGHDEAAAIAGLIELSQDKDVDVRDWATFGLGQMTELDTPEIRHALLLRLEDPDAETRGEALIGLASRGERKAMPALRKELEGEFHGSWALQSAAFFGDPELRPLIESLQHRSDDETTQRFGSDFRAAIDACTGRES